MLSCISGPVCLSTLGLLFQKTCNPGFLVLFSHSGNESIEFGWRLATLALDPSARKKRAQRIKQFLCVDFTALFARTECGFGHIAVMMYCSNRIKESGDERSQLILESVDLSIDNWGIQPFVERQVAF